MKRLLTTTLQVVTWAVVIILMLLMPNPTGTYSTSNPSVVEVPTR